MQTPLQTAGRSHTDTNRSQENMKGDFLWRLTGGLRATKNVHALQDNGYFLSHTGRIKNGNTP